MTLDGGVTSTYTWSKSDLGVPENGKIQDVIYNMENTDSLTAGFWASFSITEDSVKMRMYNSKSVRSKCEFRLSVIYVID